MFARGRSKRNSERTGQLMIEFENLPIYFNLLSHFNQKNQPDGSSLTGDRFDKENISFAIYIFSLLKIIFVRKSKPVRNILINSV